VKATPFHSLELHIISFDGVKRWEFQRYDLSSELVLYCVDLSILRLSTSTHCILKELQLVLD
jgi:hypothetical protein